MPTYRITSPDGRAFDVTAPDGASQDQVLEYAKSQWSKGAAEPAKPSPIAGLDDPGFLSSMGIAAGKSLTRMGQGMKQLYYGATGNDTEQARLSAEVAEEDRLYKPLRDERPWATGLGEALPSLALPGFGTGGVLAQAGKMAAAGAIPGLLEHGTAAERGARGAIGATAGAAFPIAGAAIKTGKAFVEPLTEGGRSKIVGRTMNRAAGPNAGQVAGRMSNAAEVVPGSAPTAAQVAQSGGIAALERSAAAANPEAYAQRAMEQSSARLSALRGIAKDDAALAAAEAQRATAAAPLYGKADAGIAPLDAAFEGLMKRGQFRTAVGRAQELANDGGLADIFFRDSKGNPIALIGEGAHLIKKALDEAGEFGAKSYTGKAGARNANNTNDLFQGWLDNSIPEYRAARDTFAKASEPINQMQVGRGLLDAVSPALADYGALGKETAGTYARALRNADATAAKATGMPGARMGDVMTPQQMQILDAIGIDLGRKANAQDLGRGVGSDTFQKLAMQNIAQQSGMPKAVGGLLGMPGVSRATAWAYRDADEKMQQALAEALLDPKKAAGLMSSVMPKQGRLTARQKLLLEQTLLRSGLLGAPAASETVAP